MENKGAVALARRHKRELEKLLATLDTNPFGENNRGVYEALKIAEEKALMCANGVCLSLGDRN